MAERARGLIVFYVAYLTAAAAGAAWAVSRPEYDASDEQRRAAFSAAMGWGIYVAAIALAGNALVYRWGLRRLPALPPAHVTALQTAAGVAAAALPSLPIPGMSAVTALLVVPAAASAAVYAAAIMLFRRRYGRLDARA